MCEIIKSENNKLSKKLRDLPRYPIILEYEKKMKDDYVGLLKKMSFEISKSLIKFIIK
jgi:hypothetical protein